MANRRFEMYQYRQLLTRMRSGESDRAMARSGLMGRQKASALREVAGREGWLEASSAMPDDATLAQVLDVGSSRPQSASSVLPYQDKVTLWWRQGIRGTVIHQALVDTYGYAGLHSSIRQSLKQVEDAHPDVTTVSVSCAKQAAAFDGISRWTRSCLFSRRNRGSSSRPCVVRPSVRRPSSRSS